ncbi:hypothetical protein Micbo1qcDRAFT_192677 [Microdochium bolleyi]|uniref:Diphthamide biosynthesis protein 4 n=1 Tax=Microdochium bolleyi TaxID=196109 RepID=A0A136JF41_9PEZI|nr:hypothetical protein Micbo1qcDRAFT_192677 [Microdochium bolleyi]
MAPPNSKQPTLYEILSLTPKHLEGQAASAQSKVVKKAYHRALLQHHPDKTAANSSSSGNDGEATAASSKSKSKASAPKGVTYTVDQIQEAYTTLSDTKKRAEYNRSLASTSSSSSSGSRQQQFTHTATFSATQSFQTGLEIVDLDDVDFDERKGLYFRACRCGNPRGYRFKESNLEENEDEGVLMVECLDCSLWLKVLFTAAVDDNNGGNAQSQPSQQGNQARANSSSSQQYQPAQRSQSNNSAARRDSSQSVSRNGSSGESKGGWSFKHRIRAGEQGSLVKSFKFQRGVM